MADKDVLPVGERRLKLFFNTLQEELYGLGPLSFGAHRQVQRAQKRARVFNDQLQAKAVSDFLETNTLVGQIQLSRPPSKTLDKDVIVNARHFVTTMLERYTSSFDELSIQRPLELSFLFDNWRFGPGASHGIKGTHTADKIAQDMTCTALCEPLVRKLRGRNPYFVAKDGHDGVQGTRVIRGSKLATVPKNEDTERTIAIEPSGNMALQLAAGLYLEGTLRYIGLDIRTQQPKNKAAAQRGSLSGDLATLDLKSASDMISIDLVRALFPDEWFDLFMLLRSDEIKLPNGEWVKLNMISTMGNGFTFPLMTFVIVALIYGYRCVTGGPRLFMDWSSTCVFGDDIIIPVHEYNVIVDVLTCAGLIVNLDKSFCDGPFRESCGGDYYYGRDVTPVYVKSLTCELDVYVAINQVLSWSTREGFFLPRSLTYLKSLLRGKVHLVPEWKQPNQGILTLGCPKRYTYLSSGLPSVPLSKEAMHFAVPLASGGYLESAGDALFFIPRGVKPSVGRVRRSRLPNGFLDGWDPLLRARPSAEIIATKVSIIFAD